MSNVNVNVNNYAVESLQTEVEFYRQNQIIVEQEIRTLIADNQKLSQQVGSLLKEKLQVSQQALENDQSKELEELTKQVSLLTKERDSLYVLWQTSQKTIDALETELQTYQSYDNRRGSRNQINDKRDLELKLESALSDYIQLESEYKKLQTDYNSLETELKSKEKVILSYKERGKELEKEVGEVKKLLDDHKINLAIETKSNEELRSQLTMCRKECGDSAKREAEAKSKVAEALQLFDLVYAQKNEAIKKIAELSAELSATKQKLSSIKRDTEETYRVELDELKEKYNEKVSDMLEHVRNLDTEIVEKGMLLNKALRENKILQSINDDHVKQQNQQASELDPRLALAEQRLEAMFQELVSSERRNIQLVCEKQSLVFDITRIQDAQSRETKRRDWEEKLLKTQCEELKLQVEHLQKSLDETHKMITKLQTMLTSRTEINQKMVFSKEEELIELNKHLENQMELNKKWKESYVDMTEKLKKRLEALQKENKELRGHLKMPQVGSSNPEDSNTSS